MHQSYLFITQTKVKEMMNTLEQHALIFSALCHDVGHTGKSNAFEVNSFSKLAIRYHDKSVFAVIFQSP